MFPAICREDLNSRPRSPLCSN